MSETSENTTGPSRAAGFASGLLAGKVALVSGASSGIGSVTAQQLAQCGATVVLLARNETKLKELSDEITATGGHAVSAPADLQDSAAVAAAVDSAVGQLGPIDLLVHSAVEGKNQVFMCDQNEDDWTRTIDTNLVGAYRLARAVVPSMMERRSGGIVFVSSIAGKRGLPANTAYCASKAGMIGLTQALAAELGVFDVRVNAVCPGLTASPGTLDPDRYGTDFMASLAKHHGPEGLTWSRYVKRAVSGTALRRMVEPIEVAHQIVYLLSHLSGGTTGQAVSVDAGAL